MCVKVARPSGRARCSAGAGCSAIKHQSLSLLGVHLLGPFLVGVSLSLWGLSLLGVSLLTPPTIFGVLLDPRDPSLRSERMQGSTSFGASKVRCWHWLFGHKIPVSLLTPPTSFGGEVMDTLLRIPSTEGRSVCLCRAKSKHKGPEGPFYDTPLGHLSPNVVQITKT